MVIEEVVDLLLVVDLVTIDPPSVKTHAQSRVPGKADIFETNDRGVRDSMHIKKWIEFGSKQRE